MNGFVPAKVGYAAGTAERGVAYVRVGEARGAAVLRVPFAFKRFAALRGREVGYAALTQVLAALRERGIQRARLILDDAGLAEDLREHREVPKALALAYVRLGCALNQLRAYEIAIAPENESDLTARARADAALNAAA